MKQLQGIFIPVVTPFNTEGEIDYQALGRLIDRFVQHDVPGVLLMGTTGEGLSLSLRQRMALLEWSAEHLPERMIGLANVSHTSFQDVLYLAHRAREVGMAACLAHLPPYYSLEEREIETYFLRLGEALPLPLVLYNIPQNTHMPIPLEVVERLSGHQNIVGIKDSEPDEARQRRGIAFARERTDFVHLLGVARFARWGLEHGAHGGILAVGNLVPGVCVALYRAVRQGDHPRAARLQALVDHASRLYASGRTMGQGIAAMKVVLHELGFCHPHVLPPLLVPDVAEQARIREEMHEVFSEEQGNTTAL